VALPAAIGAQELGVVVTFGQPIRQRVLALMHSVSVVRGVDGRRPPPSSPGFALFALGMSRKVPAELLSLRVEVMA
jgi:hypothetical protein